MHSLEVGKPYIPGRSRWPEGCEYNYRGGENELRLSYGDPSPREVAAVQKGRALFGLYHEGDQVILCYRFGDLAWSDAPFHLARLAAAGVPAEERTPPPDPATLSPESRAILQVVLVDAGPGIVRVLRAVTLSPEFTSALFGAIRDQASRPYDRASYEAGLDRIYRRYGSDQLAAACRVRCEGGA